MNSPRKTAPPAIPYAPSADDRPCSRPGYFLSEQYDADIRALRERLMADEEFQRMFPPVKK